MDALPSGPRLARFRTRLLALIYEALILAALLILATALFTAAVGDSGEQPARTLLRIYLVLVAGAYFVWSWTGGRRTLAMRTWRLRLVDAAGAPPSLKAAIRRYLVALVGVPLGGIGILWAFVDRERLFLHDRLAGTRLIVDPTPRQGAHAPR